MLPPGGGEGFAEGNDNKDFLSELRVSYSE